MSFRAALQAWKDLRSSKREDALREIAHVMRYIPEEILRVQALAIEAASDMTRIQERLQADTLQKRRYAASKRVSISSFAPIPNKTWMEKAAKIDYEHWYTNCNRSVLADPPGEILYRRKFTVTSTKSPAVKQEVVAAGSLTGLVAALVGFEFPDTDYSRAFLITYRTFSTPLDLFGAMVARFRIMPPEWMTDEKQIEYYYISKVVPIRQRFAVVLKDWLEDHFDDFLENGGELLDRVKRFIAGELSPLDSSMANLLTRLIERLEASHGAAHAPHLSQRSPTKTRDITEPLMDPRWERDPDNLLAIDATEFARQLCLLHQETVARIQSLDLLTRTVPMTEMAMSGAHDHPGADSDADAIAHAIKLGNQLRILVITQLLRRTLVADRQALLRHFVMIAEACHQFHNFNAMVGILNGLLTPAILRLRETWAVLKRPQDRELLASFIKMRGLLEESSTQHDNLYPTLSPSVACVALAMVDMVFVNNELSDTVAVGERAFINFEKRRAWQHACEGILSSRLKTYPFGPWPALQRYLLSLPSQVASNEDLLRQSLQEEPPTPTGDAPQPAPLRRPTAAPGFRSSPALFAS